jgi:hypothetical protein
MTVLTFPSSPTLGQTYDAPNGLQYVYDGVKWVVETISSPSEAVTNSTQDRVAPMFVEGEHDGITFTYDAGTNTMSATVTSTVGTLLSNNNHEFSLENDGTVTLDGEPFTSFSGDYTDLANKPTLSLVATSNSYNDLSNKPSLFSGSYSDLTNKPTIPADISDLTDTQNLLGGGATPGAIAQGAYEVSVDSAGVVRFPGPITQGFQAYTNCPAGADTVVYTTTESLRHAVKLFAIVEGLTDGGDPNFDTQACDIIAVKGYNNDIVHVTTYGVTYTGATAIATFDGRWNATTSKIEITCSPVSVTNLVYVSVHAIEMISVD